MPDHPVTKDELEGAIDGAVGLLRGEIAGAKEELRGEIAGAKEELRGEIHRSVDGAVSLLRGEMRVLETTLVRHIAEASEHTARVVEERIVDRLGLELARHVKASEERNREFMRGLDDRYRDLPDRTAALRRDLDTHVADDTRHLGPPAGGADRDR